MKLKQYSTSTPSQHALVAAYISASAADKAIAVREHELEYSKFPNRNLNPDETDFRLERFLAQSLSENTSKV